MIDNTITENLRQRLKDYVDQITPQDKRAGKDMYVCPLCGSGDHGGRNSDGAFHVTGEKWYCHACHQGGDIFTLIKLHDGIQDFSDQVRRAEEVLGAPSSTAPKEYYPGLWNDNNQSDPKRRDQIKDFASQISGSKAEKYLHERGFSDDLIRKYRLGYNPQCYVYKLGRSFETVVIPHPGTDYYTERLLDYDGDNKYQNQTGEAPVFRIKESDSDSYFIMEGQLDALSAIQAGAKNVIALGGASYKKLESIKIDGAVIVADRDSEEKRGKDGLTPGERTAKAIEKKLSDRKIKSVTIFPPAGYKDINDLLRADPELLRKFLQGGQRELSEKQVNDLNRISVSDYLRLGLFDADLGYFAKYRHRKIGFDNIDRHLTIYPGVAFLGACASSGKTTFAVNIVDNLLRSSESVIYVTLEQTRAELVTKSLARRMYEIDPHTTIDNIDIKNGRSSPALEKARIEYAQVSERYKIFAGNFKTTSEEICDYVENFIQNTGIKPIVVIDYLQLIAPPDGFKGTQREITDANLKAIKDLSKRNELFILLISSYNRASYYLPATTEAFKESGLIEYIADYIFCLQPAIMEDPDFFTTQGVKGGERESSRDKKDRMLYEAITQPVRDVEFICLKNRNGKQRFKCFFRYFVKYDKFMSTMNSQYDPAVKINRTPTKIV